MWMLKVGFSLFVALLPSFLKIPVYRYLYGYRIGKGVRIKFGVVIVGVRQLEINDNVEIGYFNVFYQVKHILIGESTRIGFCNVFRGGDRINIGRFSTILRFNVINSILKPDVVNKMEPILDLGIGAVITTGHWIDFTDRVSIGANTIIGGRNSSFWTHNRQRTRPIEIGPHCYLGSEIRVAPGVELPTLCVVAVGSVLIGNYDLSRSLIAGNPAKVLRELNDRDLFLVTRKTRKDIPDIDAISFLPEDIRSPEIPESEEILDNTGA